MDLLRFVVAALATWRVTHLLAYEDGPADMFVRVRKKIRTHFLAELMDCFQCMSLWIAAPFGWYMSGKPLEWIVTWLGLSGAACLLEGIAREPLVIERLSEQTQREPDHGMLRSETRTAQ